MSRPFLPDEIGLNKSARIRFTRDEYRSLDDFAASLGFTFSDLVRTALKVYISQVKAGKKRKMGFQDDVIG